MKVVITHVSNYWTNSVAVWNNAQRIVDLFNPLDIVHLVRGTESSDMMMLDHSGFRVYSSLGWLYEEKHGEPCYDLPLTFLRNENLFVLVGGFAEACLFRTFQDIANIKCDSLVEIILPIPAIYDWCYEDIVVRNGRVVSVSDDRTKCSVLDFLRIEREGKCKLYWFSDMDEAVRYILHRIS